MKIHADQINSKGHRKAEGLWCCVSLFIDNFMESNFEQDLNKDQRIVY